MANREPVEGSWGIDPVPPRLSILSGLETGLLWGNLGVSLLVIVAGAVLVPALSLPEACVAILLGCVLGNAMLAVAGMIGADARVPGMALMRAPLGQRGSLLPTAINVLQGIGWTIFELLVIATAAAALSDELFGFRAQWVWTVVFGAFALVLALLGPIGFVRRFIRRFAVWAVPLAILYLTWWALDGADLSALWNAEGEGGLSMWQGADVVVGITVSWVPYAADYTRFSKTRRGALAGTGLGYLVPDAWLLALGAVLVLSRDLGDPAALPAAVVAGGLAAIVALFALLVTETDEAFANAYSAAVSLQNAVPRAPQELLIVVVTAVATVGALAIDFVSYQSFLLLLGSVFVPLFAVLLADWLAAGAHYSADDVFEGPAWRPGLIAAWVGGFALYQWLYPTGPSWWVDAVNVFHPPDWGIGATVPSFLVSFGIGSVVARVARGVTSGAAPA
jgi:nucleobase:cation symporter-1, NCS1 family